MKTKRDETLIDALLARCDVAVAAMEAACASIREKHNDRMAASISHNAVLLLMR